MKPDSQPLVSVLTPVYNNADYLVECIESVLAQTYQNWEYLIVNNCSTDESLAIAQRYAARDGRIRVHDNDTFLGMEANHNSALRLASPDARYCKFVFADDWIFPRCLEEMVAVAERHPTAAMVGSYALDGAQVDLTGLPYSSTLTRGRDIGRMFFLQDIYVFGTPNSLLYRKTIVDDRDPFFEEGNTHGDCDVCLDLLRTWDFGFVHQVLTCSRQRPDSQLARDRAMNTLVASRITELKRYGSDYLLPDELAWGLRRRTKEYYNYLATAVARGRFGRDFWSFHVHHLDRHGGGFSLARLIGALGLRVMRAVLNPYETWTKLRVMTPPERRT